MKKFISMISAAAILSSVAAMPVYAETSLLDAMLEKASQADFNDDGKVTNDDALIVMNYIAKRASDGPDEELEKKYDVDENGIVLPPDVTYILYYVEKNEAKEDFSDEEKLLKEIPSNEASINDDIRAKASQADFNDDGRVTLEDARIVLMYVAESGASGKEDPELEKLYDINGNGDASVVDVSCLFQYIAEITLPGDVNEDGRVNSADASYLLKYIASYDESSVKGSVMESRCFNFGDINGDGKMTPADASLILAYSAELASDETLTLADFLAARNS